MVALADRVVPEKGEVVYYVAPRPTRDLATPITIEAALVVKVHRDGAGNAQINLALDLAVFNEDPEKPMAVRRIAVPYHPYKDRLTNHGNSWFWRFESRM